MFPPPNLRSYATASDAARFPEWRVEAVLQIVDHFGAVSYETQKVEGHWRQGGVVYRDSLVKVIVDVPDTAKNRTWMRQFKGRWKTRFEQISR
jgi:hypothetical protein